jgi:hypothetical protein
VGTATHSALLDEAAIAVQSAARALSEALSGLRPRTDDDRQAMAILRTFLGQAGDPDGVRPELLLPSTLREVRLQVERLLSRLGLPLLDPADRRLRVGRLGEWGWAPNHSDLDGLSPRFGRAAGLLVGVSALVVAWLVLRS